MIIKSANLGVHPLQHLHHRSITHLGNVTRSTIVLILGNGSIQPLLVKVPKIYVNIDLYRWMYLSFIHNSNSGRICQLLALYLAAVFGLYIATICDYHASESFILVVGFRCLPAWGWVSNWLRQVPFYNASGSFCFQPYGTKSSWVSCYPTDLCMLKFSGRCYILTICFQGSCDSACTPFENALDVGLPFWPSVMDININLLLSLVQPWHRLVSVLPQTLLVCRLVLTVGWRQILQQLSFRPPRVS